MLGYHDLSLGFTHCGIPARPALLHTPLNTVDLPCRCVLTVPSMLSFICHLRLQRHAALLRIPNYKRAIGCWQSNGEGRSLTCMASIVSLTTMSGFTFTVNCPLLGSLSPSCWFLFCLFFPLRLPADWERSELADSWLRFLSHMQPDTLN